MENAKQKTIRLAYVNLIGEEQYQKFKYDINFQDGTMKLHKKTKLPNKGIGFKFIAIYVNYAIVIPHELIGIENNNGWIRIESENDLPDEDCDCHIEFSDGSVSISKYFSRKRNFLSVNWKHVVAYQKIIKPLNRIY